MKMGAEAVKDFSRERMRALRADHDYHVCLEQAKHIVDPKARSEWEKGCAEAYYRRVRWKPAFRN